MNKIMPEAPLLSVNGTLRRGDDSDITRLMPSPQFIGEATSAGTMHHLRDCFVYALRPDDAQGKSMIASGDGVKDR